MATSRGKQYVRPRAVIVEVKPTSTRHRIKLLALSYIPSTSLQPVPVSGGLRPIGPDGNSDIILIPGKPSQWILTMRNPLYENVRVVLGAQGYTPGKKVRHKLIKEVEFSAFSESDDESAPKKETADKRIAVDIDQAQTAWANARLYYDSARSAH